MSMSDLNAPVPGERPGYGTTAGPNPYVPGGAGGFLITVDSLLYINRVVSLRESTGRLNVQVQAALAGDLGNQVRVRAYYPTGTILAADIQAAAPISNHLAATIQASAAVSDHAAVALQASAALNAHAHAIITQGVAGAVAVAIGWDAVAPIAQMQDAGAAALHTFAGGAATGIQNATQTYAAGVATVHGYGAGAVTTHAYGAGTAVPGQIGSECAAIDLRTYTFQTEVMGF